MNLVCVAKAPAAEVSVIESAAIKGSAVRNEGVMVVYWPATVPVVSPVTPAPTKSSKVADSKSNTERETDAAPKNPGDGIPARIRNNRRTVHEPRYVGRHVDPILVDGIDVT